jgi:hypothetical protein
MGRFRARMVLDCFSNGIVGSNPAEGMDVCPCFSVLCCVGRGHAVGRSPSKESYQNVYKDPQFQKLILTGNSPHGLIREPCTPPHTHTQMLPFSKLTNFILQIMVFQLPTVHKLQLASNGNANSNRPTHLLIHNNFNETPAVDWFTAHLTTPFQSQDLYSIKWDGEQVRIWQENDAAWLKALRVESRGKQRHIWVTVAGDQMCITCFSNTCHTSLFHSIFPVFLSSIHFPSLHFVLFISFSHSVNYFSLFLLSLSLSSILREAVPPQQDQCSV